MTLTRFGHRLAAYSSRCLYCTPLERSRDYFPAEPYKFDYDTSRLPPRTVITEELVHQLERLSLVKFTDTDAVAHLQEAIE